MSSATDDPIPDAPSFVTFKAFKVPVFDYMLGGEMEALEKLKMRAERGEVTEYGYDVETFCVVARHRVAALEMLDAQDFSKFHFNAHTRKKLREANEVLLAPFALALKELQAERHLKQLEMTRDVSLIETALLTNKVQKEKLQEMLTAARAYHALHGTSSATPSGAATS